LPVDLESYITYQEALKCCGYKRFDSQRSGPVDACPL
jgi:hypothetical protein